MLLELLEAGITERTLAQSTRELDIAVFNETGVPHGRWMISLPAKETNPIPEEVVPLDSMLAKETTPVPMEVVSLVPLDHEQRKEAKETNPIPLNVVSLDHEHGKEAKETNPIPEKLVPLTPEQHREAKEATSLSEDVVSLAADDAPALTTEAVTRYVALAKNPPGYDDRRPAHANLLTSRERR